MDNRNSFTEYLGLVFLNPKKFSEIYLNDLDDSRSFEKKPILFVLFISVFVGIVLMFYIGYPEVFWYSDSIREYPPNLFIFGLTSPLILFGCFFLGFFLVFLFDYLVQGNITYLSLKNSIARNEIDMKVTKKDIFSMYSFTFIHTALFHSSMVFWIYFFEKFNFAKIFFPVTEVTIPVIIQASTLGIFVFLKLYSEYRINQSILNYCNRFKTIDALKSIIIKIFIMIIIFIVIILVSNSIAAQFS